MDRTSVLPEVLKRRPNKLEENLLGRVVDCYSQAWWGSQETSAPAGAEEGARDAEKGRGWWSSDTDSFRYETTKLREWVRH